MNKNPRAHAAKLLKLAIIFCCASAFSIATGTEITPAEMIQSKLPAGKTLGNANQTEILSAICSAIAQWPNDAPQIVRTAAGGRKELTADIMRQGLQCLRSDVHEANCDLVGQTVAAAMSVKADDAARVNELALQIAPSCRAAIENAGTPSEGPSTAAGASNVNPPPGSLAGGASTKQNQSTTVTVCDGGQNVELASSQQQSYLANHPGSRAGSCQATPVANK